jgi:hypothetical protein
MSAIEAAGYGIPSIHVDTPHVREGIGDAAILVPPLSTVESARAIMIIEKNYDYYSNRARAKAEWLHKRQEEELENFARFVDNLDPEVDNRLIKRSMNQVILKYRLR